MKTCKACRRGLLAEAFPPYSAAGKQGRRGTCRDCWNAKWGPVILVHQNRYYHENRNGLADRKRARSAQAYADNPQKQYARNAQYRDRYPEREAAKKAVMLAVRSGFLVKQSCERCGDEKADAHHDDYSKPLDVRWLCRIHHGEHHRLAHRAAGSLLDGIEHKAMPA